MTESPAWNCNTIRCKMFNPNIFYLPVMPAQIYGRHVLSKVQIYFHEKCQFSQLLTPLLWYRRRHRWVQKCAIVHLRSIMHSISSVTSKQTWTTKHNLTWLQDKEGQKQSLEAQGLRYFALEKCYIDTPFFQREVNWFLRRIYLERLETNLHLKDFSDL